MSSPILFSVEEFVAKRHQVNLKLSEGLAKKLKAICDYGDSDQSHTLRNLIVQEYRKIRSETVSAEASQPGSADDSSAWDESRLPPSLDKPEDHRKVKPPPRKKASGE